jgi:methylenetetrahydrofolate reductase (NADPH)
MKVTEHIAQAQGKTLFSFEILPPLKGENINSIYQSIEPLMEFKPPFVDVTYHREEFIYKDRGNGLLEKRSIRKRPGTVGICAAIMNRFQVDAVPHIICGGFTREETENALIDLHFLGIDNVLVLRGDPIKTETYFKPEADGHSYASELLEQVVDMNKGKYLEDELINTNPTAFCIGVAGYPEKHFEAPNMKSDLNWLKKKVELGAEYIVTQMFFDNAHYFNFVERCRAIGIHVPIIPGLKPLATAKQLSLLPQRFNIDIPEDLADAVLECKSNKEVYAIGVEWCVQQSKELMAAGVPVLHYYSMGKADNIRAVASELF